MALRQHSDHGAVRAVEEGNQHSQPGRPQADVRGIECQLPIPENDAQEPRNRIKEAQRLSERGELDAAWALCDRALKDDPDDVPALICATQIHFKADDNTTAYQFARRACGLAPNNPYCWGNLGNIEHLFYRFEEAEFCFEKGLSVAGGTEEQVNAQKGFIYLTYAAMLVQKGDWGRALPMARKAFAYKDKAKTRGNLGLALLALGQWKEGWPLYDAIIGFDKSRRKMQYADEPVWDGTRGKTVVVYEEQGIGDAMSFASMIPDLIRDCKHVIIDCSPKLAGLFKRSFPDATVYGSITGLGEDWRGKHKIDASISIGGLGKFYRPTPESCPGTPYLVPSEERAVMWNAWLNLLREKGPVIGIGWSGGVEHTGAKHRLWKLEDLMPLFQAVPNATWISLQYNDAETEIAAFKRRHPEVDLRQYRHATLTPDYDDTAAMVSALDLVITMQSAVGHLAGAMGKEAWVFVNKYSQWRYGPNTQKTLSWYRSVRLFRNIDGWPFEEAAQELRSRFEHKHVQRAA